MTESVVTAGAGRFEVRVTSDSHFGWVRARLSLERTMMSWLRTATALIGFGFAIVQYSNRSAQTPGTRAAYVPNAPKLLGLALIFRRVASLAISILAVPLDGSLPLGRNFQADCRHDCEERHSPVLAGAVLLIFVGVVAFFAACCALPKG